MNPRFALAWKLQLIALLVVSVLAGCLVWSMIGVFFPEAPIFLAFPVGLFATYFLAKWLGKITHFIINAFVYRGDFKQMYDDAVEVEAERYGNVQVESADAYPLIDIEVIDKSEVIGRYLDADIFDWLILLGQDGVKYKFTFEGTMNPQIDDTRRIPNDCFMLPPGILYKLQGPA